MCARFSLGIHKGMERFIMIPVDGERYRRFNVAPTTHVPVAVLNGEIHAEDQMWGIMPPWSKQRLINARAENLLEKSFFRGLMQNGRCLIPATGFYEWREEGGKKQPYHFRLRDAQPFMFAGICREGEGSREFVIITTEPNELVSPFHDRMPAILREEDLEDWLRLPASEAWQRLIPLEANRMEAFAVSPKVNSPKYESEDCIAPIEVQGALF
jgi:putative SOS response-associated peptidase YedK